MTKQTRHGKHEDAILGPRPSWAQRRLTDDDGWHAWKARVSAVCDVETDCTRSFRADMGLFDLGCIGVQRIATVKQRYTRSRRRIVDSMLDHYLVQLYLSGGATGFIGAREMKVGPKEISIFDLTRTAESEEQEADVLALLIPKDLLDDELAHACDLHGSVMTGNTVPFELLRDCLVSLSERLPRIRLRDCVTIVDLVLALLVPAVRELQVEASGGRDHSLELTALRVRRHILRNLSLSELGPTYLSERFAVSRTQLHRYFAKDGGVTAWIRTMRLRRCFADLADSSCGMSIRRIAEKNGFSCGAHFSRLFTRTFGMTPSSVREQRKQSVSQALADNHHFAEWTRSLG